MINSSFLDFLTDLIQKPCTGTLLDKKSSGGRTCNALLYTHCTSRLSCAAAGEARKMKVRANLNNASAEKMIAPPPTAITGEGQITSGLGNTVIKRRKAPALKTIWLVVVDGN